MKRGFTPLEARTRLAVIKHDLPLTGFTLIELLVVIAIIGILATTVLASMYFSKSRGKDAAVKSNLGTVQVQASLYYSIGATFGINTSLCAPADTVPPALGSVFNDANTTVDDVMKAAIRDAQLNAKGGSANVVCKASATAFTVGAKLENDKFWCVDSRGSAREVAPFTAASLSASTPLCPAS